VLPSVGPGRNTSPFHSCAGTTAPPRHSRPGCNNPTP
jgi:hypothetical protein